jgi:hypothetical protein
MRDALNRYMYTDLSAKSVLSGRGPGTFLSLQWKHPCGSYARYY